MRPYDQEIVGLGTRKRLRIRWLMVYFYTCYLTATVYLSFVITNYDALAYPHFTLFFTSIAIVVSLAAILIHRKPNG